MISTILFDLDGTLLPMDQDIFIRAYLGGLTGKLAPFGFDPKAIAKSIWMGTGAMVKNDGSSRNDEVFWKVFSQVCGTDMTAYLEPIEEFYRVEFQEVRHRCGFDPQAAETICAFKNMGFRLVLATNPLFPALATHSRVRWAGLSPEDFEDITTYEKSYHCKPNPDYYREILAKLKVTPEECLMVGNDVAEDMIARELGMQVFLLTSCLINKEQKEISGYPHGGFPELMEFVRSI